MTDSKDTSREDRELAAIEDMIDMYSCHIEELRGLITEYERSERGMFRARMSRCIRSMRYFGTHEYGNVYPDILLPEYVADAISSIDKWSAGLDQVSDILAVSLAAEAVICLAKAKIDMLNRREAIIKNRPE